MPNRLLPLLLTTLALVLGAPSAAGDDLVADRQNQSSTVATVRDAGGAMYLWVATTLDAEPAADGEDAPPGTFSWDQCPAITHERLVELLVPEFIDELPAEDGWGHPLEFCLATEPGAPYWVLGVRSPGRDGAFESDDYGVGAFDADAVDRDIVWADGYFMTWPEKRAGVH